MSGNSFQLKACEKPGIPWTLFASRIQSRPIRLAGRDIFNKDDGLALAFEIKAFDSEETCSQSIKIAEIDHAGAAKQTPIRAWSS
jgi:hypothetical protein